MLSDELASNPQPPLYQILHESAELVNYLDEPGYYIRDIPVPGALYMFYRQRELYGQGERDPRSDRAAIELVWNGQGDLLTSDGRVVTAMELEVPKNSGVPSGEPAQTYKFSYNLRLGGHHDVTIIVDDYQQQVDIYENRANLTPHWFPISSEDTERMLTIFHDALQDGKRLHDEKLKEIEDYQAREQYIKERWPDGFPYDTSQSNNSFQ